MPRRQGPSQRNRDAAQNQVQPRKNGFLSKLYGVCRSQDSFGESYSMKLEDGNDKLQTVMGSLCSIILLLITLFYAYLKFDVLRNKKDVNVLSTIKDSFFTDADHFSYKEGLNIAVAFTAYDNERNPILDPTIGELVINEYSWGVKDDGSVFSARVPLNDHECSRDELNLDDDAEDPKFFKPHPLSKSTIELY